MLPPYMSQPIGGSDDSCDLLDVLSLVLCHDIDLLQQPALYLHTLLLPNCRIS